MYCGNELKHELIETKENEDNIILDEVECPNCKTINNGLSNYCSNCGTNLKSGQKQEDEEDIIRCPICGSKDVQFVTYFDGEPYKSSLGILGGVICFPLGSLLGLTGKREQRVVKKCKKCGHEFD